MTGRGSDYLVLKTETITGQPCTATPGARGFTVTDTRVIRDAHTHAELTRHTRKVTYDPIPHIICTP